MFIMRGSLLQEGFILFHLAEVGKSKGMVEEVETVKLICKGFCAEAPRFFERIDIIFFFTDIGVGLGDHMPESMAGAVQRKAVLEFLDSLIKVIVIFVIASKRV